MAKTKQRVVPGMDSTYGKYGGTDIDTRVGVPRFIGMRITRSGKSLFLSTAVLTGVTLAANGGSLADLVRNNPFGSATNKEKSPESMPPPSLELRGIVVEDGLPWFTFFDAASKKWTTVRQGEEGDALTVRSYDKSRELVLVELQGKSISLTLKGASNRSYQPVAGSRSSTMVTAAAEARNFTVVALASMPAVELQRIQQVDGEIAKRRAERRKL